MRLAKNVACCVWLCDTHGALDSFVRIGCCTSDSIVTRNLGHMSCGSDVKQRHDDVPVAGADNAAAPPAGIGLAIQRRFEGTLPRVIRNRGRRRWQGRLRRHLPRRGLLPFVPRPRGRGAELRLRSTRRADADHCRWGWWSLQRRRTHPWPGPRGGRRLRFRRRRRRRFAEGETGGAPCDNNDNDDEGAGRREGERRRGWTRR